MADLIDRKAALDICDEYNGHGYVWLCIRGMIEQLPNENRWIPVEEAMPENDGKYLCVWQGKSIDTGLFVNGHFRLYGENKDNLVSHWMKLPEMPEVEHDGIQD